MISTATTQPKQPKLTKKQILIDHIFKPNKDGVSDWVLRETLKPTILALGSNGNGRHGAFFGDRRFNWEAERVKQRKVIALRTTGLSDDDLIRQNHPIRNDIRRFYNKKCCIVCASTNNLVPDHKNDLYNDPRVNNLKTQTHEDFQCLCTACNLRKSQNAIKTKRYGKRIGATTIPQFAIHGIDFSEGDESYDKNDVNAMVGTYWHDPMAFNAFIHSQKKI